MAIICRNRWTRLCSLRVGNKRISRCHTEDTRKHVLIQKGTNTVQNKQNNIRLQETRQKRPETMAPIIDQQHTIQDMYGDLQRLFRVLQQATCSTTRITEGLHERNECPIRKHTHSDGTLSRRTKNTQITIRDGH